MNLKEVFEKYKDEFLRSHHDHPDLYAFNLLVERGLVVGHIIDWAEHDCFGLNVDPDELAKTNDEALVKELIQCGVIYPFESSDSLGMFT